MEFKNVINRGNWIFKKLPEVLFLQEGPGVRKDQYTTSGIKLLNVANLQEGKLILESSDRYISKEEAFGKYKHFLVDEGDLIIASSGIQISYLHKKIGFAKKEHLPLCMNTSTIRFKTLDEKTMNLRYAMYFFKSIEFKKQIGRMITGSAQLNFGPSHLCKVVIPIPPINIQQKIANTLDKVQELIDKRKEQMQKLDEFLQSVFFNMFGEISKWKMVKAEELASDDRYSLSSGPFGSSLTSKDYTKEGVIVLRGVNVSKGYLDLCDIKYISDDKALELRRSEIKQSDIVVIAVGASGKAFRIPVELPRAIVSQNFNKITPNLDKVDPVYLEFIFNSNFVQDQFKKCITDTVRTFLSLTKIREVIIPLPPLELQKNFAGIVEKIERQKSLLEESLGEMEDSFNSIMQKSFRGELFKS